MSQFEKAALVAKLKAARERRKDTTGKCGGRPSLAESSPQIVALARKLRRYPLDGRKRSLREVAVELEAAGLRNQRRHALRCRGGGADD